MLASRPKSAVWNYHRASFTLIELLVVIAIIGVLAALITAAVMGALPIVQETQIRVEMQTMQNALENYKNTYGDYPPDFSDLAIVQRHVRKRWPRISAADLTIFTNMATVGHTTRLNADQALVFWLRGFSNDPQLPITGLGTRTPLIDFDKGRVVNRVTGVAAALSDATSVATITTVPVYLPPKGSRNAMGTIVPYIYFDARTYTLPAAQYPRVPTMTDPLKKKPYFNTMPANLMAPLQTDYVNPDTYQILSAGLDGDWGQADPALPPIFPIGTNYILGDRDNLGSFSTKNLQDSMP